MRIEIVPLPTWRGGLLAAEYDARRDAIRVNARAVDIVRDALGDEEARTFVRCAVAHEWYHRAACHPERSAGRARGRRTTEEDAHAFAHRQTGADPARYAALLRAAPA